MAMDTRVVGGSTGYLVEADVNNNMKVNLPTTSSQAGYGLVLQEVAATTEPGGAVRRSIEATADYMERVGVDTPLLVSSFGGSATSANAIQQDVWKQTLTTMTVAAGSPSNGYLQMNSANVNTATTGAMLSTYATWSFWSPFPTYLEFMVKTINCGNAANKVAELGAFLATDAKTAGILDGFCLRWLGNGEVRAVICMNGNEIVSSTITPPTDNVNHRYTLVRNRENLEVWIDNLLQTILAYPTDTVAQSLQQMLPIAMRIYNMGSTPALAPRLDVSEVFASQGSANIGKPVGNIMAGMGQHASNVPYGTAVGETTNQANGNATPAATQAGSNTSPNAAMTGLGGVFQMTAQAGATATGCQMIASYYQVPVNSATQASKRLVVTGVNISAINGGAAVASTVTALNWGIAWGATSNTLAASDAAATKAPRHLNLGMMSAAVGAAIGAAYSPASVGRTFGTPIYVNPGEYFFTTVSFPVGTATSSQTVIYSVAVDGYWE